MSYQKNTLHLLGKKMHFLSNYLHLLLTKQKRITMVGTLGNKLKQLREAQNKSRDQLADHLGVSLRTYTKIENNERRPTLDEIEKAAEFYNVDPMEL